MTSALRTSLMLVLFLTATRHFAQKPTMLVYGTVRDFITRDSIPFPLVHLRETTPLAQSVSVVSNGRGRYELELGEDKSFVITYGAPGKVNKSVQIDTRGPSPKEWEGGFGMNIDIVLMDSLPGLDYSILSEPFGKAAWNMVDSTFVWDIDYTRGQSARQEALLDAYRAAYGRKGVPVSK